MAKYVIDFEAWTTIEADNEIQASQIASSIINACETAFHDTDIVLDMVVREGGIEED